MPPLYCAPTPRPEKPEIDVPVKTTTVLLAAAFLCAAPLARAADAPLYTMDKPIPLGAGERWDYVTYDPVDNRAYVAHGDHVTVVDLTKGVAIGDIGPFPGGTHGIAISHATGEGFTDDGKAGIVGVFDLKTYKVKKTIPAAPDADGIILDPVSGHVFVIDGDSGVVTVIDPKTDTSIGTITIGAGLEAGDVDGKGRFYVDGAEKHEIVAIDTATDTVAAHWPLVGCEKPHGVAVDTAEHRVFASCANKVMVAVDSNTGANIATFPIGGFNDGATFDTKRARALSSNGDGTLTVVQAGNGAPALLGEVKTLPSARTIAVDPATGTLFLPAADIAKIDPPATPGGRPHVSYVPGSAKLLVLKPVQ
jgi:YVTN family beta-propeller protein